MGSRPFLGQQDPLEFHDFPTPATHLGLFKAGSSTAFRLPGRGSEAAVYVIANPQLLPIMLSGEENLTLKFW